MNQKDYKKGLWVKKTNHTANVCTNTKSLIFLTFGDVFAKVSNKVNHNPNAYITAITYPSGSIVEIHLAKCKLIEEPKDWRDIPRFMSTYNEHFECN